MISNVSVFKYRVATIALFALTFGATALPQTAASEPLTLSQTAAIQRDGEEQDRRSIAQIWNEQLLDAIRLDTPRPTVHARNLFHVSVAMWDAWAVFDRDARPYFQKTRFRRPDPEAAQHEAISYAAFRMLQHRFQIGPGAEATQAAITQQMEELGYDPTITTTWGYSPAAIGNRIAQRVINHGMTDGSNEAFDYEDYTGYFPMNLPLVFEFPGANMFMPNRWQPLAFDYLVLQNGIIIGAAIQDFIGPYWGRVTPFAMTAEDEGPSWVYFDPGMPPQLGGSDDLEFKLAANDVIRRSSRLDPTDGIRIDIGPAGNHNNPLGTQDGTGYDVNPVTGSPYEVNEVPQGDYGRVLAEYWADGPDSETPPGHWNVIANEMADHPRFEQRFEGEGPILSDVEWDLRVYLAMNGAMHDAAIAAWGAKGYYDYSRPISMIRHMAERGQSSDMSLPSYDPQGILLEDGLVELITQESIDSGRHAAIAGDANENIGKIAVLSWVGTPDDPNTLAGVSWILGDTWLPYQLDTFVTPAFAAYVSGHSTFSRAGAEVLTAITGDAYFPGGLGEFVAEQNEFLDFEEGPSETVRLQWATYYDAADEAGISRLWGGIHVPVDDFRGRIMGAAIGIKAYEKAREYFNAPDRDPADFPFDTGAGMLRPREKARTGR